MVLYQMYKMFPFYGIDNEELVHATYSPGSLNDSFVFAKCKEFDNVKQFKMAITLTVYQVTI